MRRKLVLALAVIATLGSASFSYVKAQDEVDGAGDKPYNCFGGYGGGCGDSWIKNCYC
jgi:hypothetical protein